MTAAEQHLTRADCCVASAQYVVVLPDRGELLLCGHHYRCSREALARRGALVFSAGDGALKTRETSVREMSGSK